MIQQGYLSLRQYPEKQTDVDKCDIDWSRTKAWGWGGYYARIFLNVKGREPNGTIPPEDYERERDELRHRLQQVRGPNGEEFRNKVYTPEELYGVALGDKPDLMVYFDDLYWRSAGTLGHNSLYLDENDTGPDDSVHWYDGILILYSKKLGNKSQIERMSIYDVAPSLLKIMGQTLPNGLRGKARPELMSWVDSVQNFSMPARKSL
jgi:predicted AlkP superfamily phosphohydrolase/phosphomutase